MTGRLIYACDISRECRYIAVKGATDFAATLGNARRLIERIETDQYTCVVIDFRQADLRLTPEQYGALFRLIRPAIQTLPRFAYLYDARTVLFTAPASRRVSRLGAPARALDNWPEASAFLGVSALDPAPALHPSRGR